MVYIRIILLGLVLAVFSYAIQTQVNMALTSNTFTAGNTMCRNASMCGYHNGTNYSWCYVDYNNTWDYCCTTPCEYGNKTYLWCESGSLKSYFCGNGSRMDIHERICLPSHPCGLHHEEDAQKPDLFWCYVDLRQNWGRCCHPNDHCSDKGQGYNSCYTGIMPNASFANCTSWK